MKTESNTNVDDEYNTKCCWNDLFLDDDLSVIERKQFIV